MSIIGARSTVRAEVGVATENGKSYYNITSFLNRIHIPYVDIILDEISYPKPNRPSASIADYVAKELKLIITTRKERLQVSGKNVVCIEDLGEDIGVAKEKLLSLLYPSKETDWFVVGIDPGERTGMAAFMNQLEVESTVLGSVEDTVLRVAKLIDNAPRIRKVVKIGSGMPMLAEQIARRLDSQYRQKLHIQLVDERGTSTLNSRGHGRIGTRDQRAAKLIAFREGKDYLRPSNQSSTNAFMR